MGSFCNRKETAVVMTSLLVCFYVVKKPIICTLAPFVCIRYMLNMLRSRAYVLAPLHLRHKMGFLSRRRSHAFCRVGR